MSKIYAVACSLILAVPAMASGQATPMVIGQAVVPTNVLPRGTSIHLRTMTELNSADNRTGDRFKLETVEDVVLNGVIIIPRGSPGIGELSFVKKKGNWGKSGRLQTRLVSVHANGVDVPIEGELKEKGDTGTVGVIAAVAFIPVAGFFVTGTSASLPNGTSAFGVTVAELPIQMASAAPTVAVTMATPPVAAVTTIGIPVNGVPQALLPEVATTEVPAVVLIGAQPQR